MTSGERSTRGKRSQGLPYRLVGTVLDSESRTTTDRLRVELWDNKADEPVATATTLPTGNFEVSIDVEDYRRRYGRGKPTFRLRVFYDDLELSDPTDRRDLTLRQDPARVFVPLDLAEIIRGLFWDKLTGPLLLPTVPDADPHGFQVQVVDNPFAAQTLGSLGFAVDVEGKGELPEDWVLVVPYTDDQVIGIQTRSIRLFTPGPRRVLDVIWNSSVNPEGKFIWANIRRPGLYVPIGKPRDLVVLKAIEETARMRRRFGDERVDEVTNRELLADTLGTLGRMDHEELTRLRFELTNFELQTRAAPPDPADLQLGNDGVIQPFALPGNRDLGEFNRHTEQLEIPPTGLPEEQLFFPPDELAPPDLPWEVKPAQLVDRPLPQPDPDTPLPIPWPPRPIPLPVIPPFPFGPGLEIPEILGLYLCRGKNWYMYHHDTALSGRAACSSIRSTNIADLQPTSPTPTRLDGPILSIPSIVNGKVYVGTVRSDIHSNRSGTMYKIDLATGAEEASFPLPTQHATRPTENPLQGARQWGLTGVGSSPAVVGGRVYISTLTGFVYCLDANSLACLWYTDLRKRHLSKNQPIQHSVQANGWSSPLVVNDRVYVGFGEGESNTWGFVYCLDATNGRVIWLFCTNKFANPDNAGSENQPNVLPPSLAPSSPPSGFTVAASNPPNQGASPWSHASYDYSLNRVFIGTGNSIGDDVLPEPRYSNGVLSLDATTGEFRGFFQPDRTSNYRPTAFENDIDVPAGPMLFTRSGQRFLGIGSKNGSFFILDPASMNEITRRQMLPYQSNGSPFDAVDPIGVFSENRSGVMATAAVNNREQTIFVPVGGYANTDSIDRNTTPFMRAVDWRTLADAWPTSGTNPPKYSNVGATMYMRAGEAGMASPATVNDVVFMSTTSSGLYAYRATDGLHLRTLVSPGSPFAAGSMGPAIYGQYVVAGFWSGDLRIFKLQP